MDRRRPLILSLDTATPCSTVSLTRGNLQDGQVLAFLGLSGKVTHSRRLLTAVKWLMAKSEVDWTDIDAIAVGLGPGSFTGLRIGMATAKGLAAASGKNLLGISTLDVLAAACCSGRLICSVLDARKKEVYSALYRPHGQNTATRLSEITAGPAEILAENLTEPVLMVGDGAVTYRQTFVKLLGEDVSFAPCHLNEPSAAVLGMLACEAFLRGESLDQQTAVPLYIRSSDAELNLLKKKQALDAPGKKGGQ
jgi:tRNA threonylcarbamoyladenosine biosynthesis protein TsaB